MIKVLIPMGTRPEIIKLAPVVRSLSADKNFDVRTVATGQHFERALTDDFYTSFNMQPDERWSIDGDEASRVGNILTLAYRELSERRPDLVLLLGDTYTVPLFCLAARSRRVPVAHLEAGLRSFNPTSMEEVNRHIAAATASLHFAPTPLAARFLRSEGVDQARIRIVGNPVTDVLRRLRVRRRPPDERSGVIVTAHRATNVDDPERLDLIVTLVRRLASEVGPVTFPLHPRTRSRLVDLRAIERLTHAHVRVRPPLGYEEMIHLLGQARLVVTDSGGLQEEASWLGIPTVVLRRSTPRWEGVMAGVSALVGLDLELALETSSRFASIEEQARIATVPCPYGDGHVAPRVKDILADPATRGLLELREPDFVSTSVPA